MRKIKRHYLPEINRTLVLNTVRDYQPISRVEIARKSRLHKSTVTQVVKELLSRRLLVEVGKGASTKVGGRRPRFLSLDLSQRHVIGVEIAPSVTRIALADFNGEIKSRWNLKTTSDPQRFLSDLVGELANIIGQGGGCRFFEGVGISYPGMVKVEEGKLLYSGNLGWRNLPIVSRLKQVFDLPITVDNDLNMSALAELRYGDVSKRTASEDFAIIYVGHGLGVGLVINGNLHRGFSEGAHNFGHMTIQFKGARCSCGNRGCWESFASDRATVARYCQLSGASGKKYSQESWSIDEVIARARAGEEAAVQAVKATAIYLGIGIANLVNGLNLPAFVIGGRITSAWALIEEPLRSSLQERALRENLENVLVSPTILGGDQPLIGAIVSILERTFAYPALD